MAASGQVTSGYWAAVLIGVVLLVTFIATTTTGIMRVYRARHNEAGLQPIDGLSDLVSSGMGPSLGRCQALIAEAVIVRQRLSGEIDAETYQIRMNELARQAISERRPQPNA
jgi:hypothetical protein